MIYGYARVSKSEQNLDMQIDALKKYGVEKIFEEKITGTRSDRKELQILLGLLQAGDTLVLWKLDRLGRTAKNLIELAENFEAQKINLVSLMEKLDTTTAMGKFVFTVFCAVAQMERDVIAERTKEGLAAARARGRIGGRRPPPPEKIQMMVEMYYSRRFTMREIEAATGVGHSTVYKYINSAGGAIKPDREKANLAIKMYLSREYTIKEIVEKTGLSDTTICAYTRPNRDKVQQMFQTMGTSDIQEIITAARAKNATKAELAIKMYLSCKYTVKEIVAATGLGETAIWKYTKPCREKAKQMLKSMGSCDIIDEKGKGCDT